jgi:REP element-mobilizing transposase RayT
MARKLRVQYPGALYHVVNRGNYRRDVFESVGAAQALVTAVEEAAQAFGWRIHAYVVMRNHYHLVVETTKPNLVSGMHWLQSTLARRFNRFRTERGHLFQGRYHAGLIEDFRVLEDMGEYHRLMPGRPDLPRFALHTAHALENIGVACVALLDFTDRAVLGWGVDECPLASKFRAKRRMIAAL